MKLFIFALLVLAVTAISSDWEQFQSFKVKYGKTYTNKVEEVKRFNIFKDNLRIIEVNNAKFEQGLVSYQLGVNQYTDWTHEEFLDYFNIKPIHPESKKQFSLDREQFEAFKVEYGKTYANQEEEEKRFNIFKENLEIIEENNAKFEQGLVSYQLAVNKYSDWTNEEFKEYFHLPAIKLPENVKTEKSLEWEQFQSFKVQFGKTYANEEEEEKRFNIFKENLEIIEENNAKFEQGLVSYQLAVNKYSDWTNEEFKEYFHLPAIKLPENVKSEKSLEWEQFQSFKVQFGKTYANEEEEEKRFNIFKENLEIIEENNAKFEQGLVSYQLGVNKFSDLTIEEFRECLHLPAILPKKPTNVESGKLFSLDKEQFEAFKVQYGKTYANQEEEEERFNIFKENLEIIEEHNAKFEQGLVSYQLGVNKFSDWTREEFREYFHLPAILPGQKVKSGKLSSLDREQFESFKAEYGKTYTNQVEEEKRFNIFQENLEIIEEHNAKFEQGLVSYQLGVNKYTDWTNEEFMEYFHLPGIKLAENVKSEESLEWEQFLSFQVEYSKTYANQEEEAKRFNIFKANLEMIEEHNAKFEQGLVSYQLGVNKYTDWTNEEFMEYFHLPAIRLPETETSLEWEQFQSFKVQYDKTYANKEEEEKRFNIFKENLEMIEEHNAKFEQGLVSYKIGLNQFSDRRPEEFIPGLIQ